ncbi:MAG: recombinase family protein [Acetobacter sp.]|nr:recombinase family protein [Acetobacter sp.]MCH4086952.1 recombinase family protein [Acetobacter sp.]MCI1486302.1 recombinase family protein [Acetobacter sp.]MCI1601932.1 recombinase family protein [Acetobacter sp.]
MLGAIAEFERALMRERQPKGIVKVKEQGKYRGRKSTAMAPARGTQQMESEGVSDTYVAMKLNISCMSAYRALND